MQIAKLLRMAALPVLITFTLGTTSSALATPPPPPPPPVELTVPPHVPSPLPAGMPAFGAGSRLIVVLQGPPSPTVVWALRELFPSACDGPCDQRFQGNLARVIQKRGLAPQRFDVVRATRTLLEAVRGAARPFPTDFDELRNQLRDATQPGSQTRRVLKDYLVAALVAIRRQNQHFQRPNDEIDQAIIAAIAMTDAEIHQEAQEFYKAFNFAVIDAPTSTPRFATRANDEQAQKATLLALKATGYWRTRDTDSAIERYDAAQIRVALQEIRALRSHNSDRLQQPRPDELIRLITHHLESLRDPKLRMQRAVELSFNPNNAKVALVRLILARGRRYSNDATVVAMMTSSEITDLMSRLRPSIGPYLVVRTPRQMVQPDRLNSDAGRAHADEIPQETPRGRSESDDDSVPPGGDASPGDAPPSGGEPPGWHGRAFQSGPSNSTTPRFATSAQERAHSIDVAATNLLLLTPRCPAGWAAESDTLRASAQASVPALIGEFHDGIFRSENRKNVRSAIRAIRSNADQQRKTLLFFGCPSTPGLVLVKPPTLVSVIRDQAARVACRRLDRKTEHAQRPTIPIKICLSGKGARNGFEASVK